MTIPAAGWALALPDDDLAAAAALRIEQNVLGAVVQGCAWVCGPSTDCQVVVPGAQRFRVDPAGALYRGQGRIPCGRLPDAPWLPLADLLPVCVASVPALSALMTTTLTLVADDVERPVAGVLVAWDDLVTWVGSAPEHRCAVLRVARDRQGRALVLGAPLPALRGLPLWAHGVLLIPCGQALSPPVPMAWAQQALALPAGDHVLVHEGAWQRLSSSAFASLTRALVRSEGW